jgi:hypothetical protein
VVSDEEIAGGIAFNGNFHPTQLAPKQSLRFLEHHYLLLAAAYFDDALASLIHRAIA